MEIAVYYINSHDPSTQDSCLEHDIFYTVTFYKAILLYTQIAKQ